MRAAFSVGNASGLDSLARLGALGALGRELEHVPLPLEVDAERDVAGLVADGPPARTFKNQRPGLPLADVVGHRSGHAADQVVPTSTTASVMTRR